MPNEFTAIIETAEEGGYFTYCPEIPGANGQGETIEECRNDLIKAIALILEDRREDAIRHFIYHLSFIIYHLFGSRR